MKKLENPVRSTGNTEISYEDIYNAEYSGKRDVEFFKSRLLKNNSKRVLEVGCGTGRIFDGLLRANPTINYIGVDYSEAAIDHFRQSHLNTETICGVFPDCMPEGFRGSFDAVLFTFNGLSYIPDGQRPAFFRACHSSLAFGGHLLLHFFRFDINRIKEEKMSKTPIREIVVNERTIGKYIRTEVLEHSDPGSTRRMFVYKFEDDATELEISKEFLVYPCIVGRVLAQAKAAGFANIQMFSDPESGEYDENGDNLYMDLTVV